MQLPQVKRINIVQGQSRCIFASAVLQRSTSAHFSPGFEKRRREIVRPIGKLLLLHCDYYRPGNQQWWQNLSSDYRRKVIFISDVTRDSRWGADRCALTFGMHNVLFPRSVIKILPRLNLSFAYASTSGYGARDQRTVMALAKSPNWLPVEY